MQRLLNFSPSDEDAARDVLVRHVVARMGDPGAVLAVDETDFPKNGKMSLSETPGNAWTYGRRASACPPRSGTPGEAGLARRPSEDRSCTDTETTVSGRRLSA
jgi:DDE superfamily endonuclease